MIKQLLQESLLEMIKNRNADIAVVGLGYVGLPSAALFANSGFRVTGLDINQEIVNEINNGSLRSKEVGLENLIAKAHKKGLLNAMGMSPKALGKANIVIICVQTPLDKLGNANLSFLKEACEVLSQALRKDKLIILQSTVPPQTIETIIVPILEKGSRLKCGLDFWLSYCPERMAPGTGLDDLKRNTRLIGGYNAKSAVLTTELYKCATDGKLLVTDIPIAEISKLAENAFRYVNIAFANELALICGCLDVDVNEVIKLANTHPRVNIHQPGCGAGGPCLSKDSHLLLDAVKYCNCEVDLLVAAVKLNNRMPKHVVEIASNALGKIGKDVANSRIAVFGTAYKGGVNDSRESPAEGVVMELRKRQARIVTFDPNCNQSFGEMKAKNLEEAVSETDCIIVTTDHKEFCDLDLPKIKLMMRRNPIIVDTKRIINPSAAKSCGFTYKAISGVKADTVTGS